MDPNDKRSDSNRSDSKGGDRVRTQDAKFKRIHEQIEIQEQQLMKNLREIVAKSKQNEYLSEVQEEHKKHMLKLEQKKRRLITSFELLIEHLRKLAEDDKLSKPDMDDVKFELKRVKNELKKIMAENFS
jgi:hypothetical protein